MRIDMIYLLLALEYDFPFDKCISLYGDNLIKVDTGTELQNYCSAFFPYSFFFFFFFFQYCKNVLDDGKNSAPRDVCPEIFLRKTVQSHFSIIHYGNYSSGHIVGVSVTYT